MSRKTNVLKSLQQLLQENTATFLNDLVDALDDMHITVEPNLSQQQARLICNGRASQRNLRYASVVATHSPVLSPVGSSVGSHGVSLSEIEGLGLVVTGSGSSVGSRRDSGEEEFSVRSDTQLPDGRLTVNPTYSTTTVYHLWVLPARS